MPRPPHAVVRAPAPAAVAEALETAACVHRVPQPQLARITRTMRACGCGEVGHLLRPVDPGNGLTDDRRRGRRAWLGAHAIACLECGDASRAVVYDRTMRRTGMAELPRHGGRAPAWRFGRMTTLTRAVALARREDEEPAVARRRLAGERGAA